LHFDIVRQQLDTTPIAAQAGRFDDNTPSTAARARSACDDPQRLIDFYLLFFSRSVALGARRRFRSGFGSAAGAGSAEVGA
jgi:hypothetical protein